MDKEDGLSVVNLETGFRDPDVSQKVQGPDSPLGVKKALSTGQPVSAIIDPPDGRIPFQAWAAAARTQTRNRYRTTPLSLRDSDPEVFCVVGVPLVTYFLEFQIVQTPGYIVMVWERNHDYRVISLDGRPHVPSRIKLTMGDARGHWEGNTLVVDTTNLNDWSWLDKHEATFHSDAMSLVERYTFVDANTLTFHVTIQDPKVFTRPWTMAMTLKRTHGPAEGYELMEYACAEGERGLPVFLKRIQEQRQR
jgi:hypothetical protein